jgi:hypothetical protein
MCKQYNELEFTHFVIDSTGEAIFGTARVNGSGRVASFLINGVVKQRTGEAWKELDVETSELIRKRAISAYNRIPTYRANSPLF